MLPHIPLPPVTQELLSGPLNAPQGDKERGGFQRNLAQGNTGASYTEVFRLVA